MIKKQGRLLYKECLEPQNCRNIMNTREAIVPYFEIAIGKEKYHPVHRQTRRENRDAMWTQIVTCV